jgi:hypothetical protein
MKRYFFSLLVLSGLSRLATAQDFPYSVVSQEEMDMKSYAKDTSAHAVVLQEYGTSRINLTNDDNIKLIFEYHVKIKIFDSKGFDNGTIQVPVYHDNDNDAYEDVDEITGVTYYKDDNGLTQKVELENKKIYPVKEDKHWANYKFALPGLRNGCVIEYKYRLVSPYFLNDFHSWTFQGNIPKVYSEYEVYIPGHFNYNASLRGALKLTKNTVDIERGCFTAGSAHSDCSHITYGIKDIPAFIEEDHMTSPKNFISAMSFELVEWVNPYNGSKTIATKEWKDIDYLLKTHEGFGTQLKKKDLFKERLMPVIAGHTDDLSKAKAVYAYLQKWFKWNDHIGAISPDGIKSALNSHSGSIADINISLVAALNSVGINTEAVLLSTRDHGFVNDLYPAVTDFNYVVAKANIGDKSYMLDASDPLLPFGMLPLTCLNDKGRVFSLDKPSYWMDLNLPQKDDRTITIDLTLTEDGKLKGTIVNYSIGYRGYEKRKAIKKFNTVDEYVDDFYGKLPKIKILKSEISNLDSLDLPLSEKYDIEIDVYNKLNGNQLTFNPFFLDKISDNPFKLATRTFPVDWGMASEDRFVLTMRLPAGYIIETPPPAVAISLPNNGGKFLTGYEPDNNSFTFSHVVQFKKSIYSPGEYPYLKELYNKIIQSEKAEMVFKKKQ